MEIATPCLESNSGIKSMEFYSETYLSLHSWAGASINGFESLGASSFWQLFRIRSLLILSTCQFLRGFDEPGVTEWADVRVSGVINC